MSATLAAAISSQTFAILVWTGVGILGAVFLFVLIHVLRDLPRMDKARLRPPRDERDVPEEREVGSKGREIVEDWGPGERRHP